MTAIDTPLSSSPPYAAPGGRRIGDILVNAKLLTPEQVEEVVRHAGERQTRFGEAAVELGFVDEQAINRALATQFDMRLGNPGLDGEPVAFTAPHSVAAEDYRSIRNALALRWFKHPQGARSLAVVSPSRGDGRSLMAANLAVCFAQVGFQTLLIDADMRNPSQHRLFKLDNRFGLASYLAGQSHGEGFHAVPEVPSLTVMPVGPLPSHPQELLLRETLHQLVGEAREHFEMVVFDTPAADVGSDYQIIGAEAVGALIVTRREQTRMRETRKLVDACRDFGIRIVGSAMHGASPRGA